jgi:peptidyl-prolyl cis-trans isomerase B (cyclophilin B)
MIRIVKSIVRLVSLVALATLTIVIVTAQGEPKAAETNPPQVIETNFCSDVSNDAGETEMATKEMIFDGPEDVINPDTMDYYGCIVTTRGVIEVTLFDDNAPKTVNSFVFLAREGFYDGVLWHRVVPAFVAQGGDRNGAIEGAPGTGGPGYQYADEPGGLALTYENVGTVGMAHRGVGTSTNGSQFFISLDVDCCRHLDGAHPIFGQVSGAGDMEVVLSLEQGDLIQTIIIIEIERENGDFQTRSRASGS